MRLFLLLLVLAVLTAGAYAQNTTEQPLVALVVDNKLGTPAISDPRPIGISNLVQIFEGLGAEIQAVNLDQDLPAAARVVILVGPQSPLSAEQLARLWSHMERGNHLLLAIDPPNSSARRTDSATSGLAVLLNNDYGIHLQDSFLAEPWFTADSMDDEKGSLLFASPDALPHPVTAPLDIYNLSVQIWGARTLRVEPFGINSRARPLLVTVTAYGETSRRIFSNRDRDPLELNIGVDFLGKLNLAALGENTATGSRIAVLGDSEMAMNGFGLSTSPSTGLATYVGNRIFIERLAAWLLDIPVEQWPPLPSGFTWIVIDGDSAEWEPIAPVLAVDMEARAFRQVRAFHNDAYAYLLVETNKPVESDVRLELTFSSKRQGEARISIQGSRAVLVQPDGTETPLPDARIVAGPAIEIRLPLRATGSIEVSLSRLCLFEGEDTAQPQSCFGTPITVTEVKEQDPANLRLSATPIGTVNPTVTSRVNLRRGPSTTLPIVSILEIGTLLAVTGRDKGGNWIKVESAGFSGWLLAALATVNMNIMTLPEVEP